MVEILQADASRHLHKALHNAVFAHARSIACHLVHVSTLDAYAYPAVVHLGIYAEVLAVELVVRRHALVARIGEREARAHVLAARRRHNRVVNLTAGIVEFLDKVLLRQHFVGAVSLVSVQHMAPVVNLLPLHLRAPAACCAHVELAIGALSVHVLVFITTVDVRKFDVTAILERQRLPVTAAFCRNDYCTILRPAAIESGGVGALQHRYGGNILGVNLRGRAVTVGAAPLVCRLRRLVVYGYSVNHPEGLVVASQRIQSAHHYAGRTAKAGSRLRNLHTGNLSLQHVRHRC